MIKYGAVSIVTPETIVFDKAIIFGVLPETESILKRIKKSTNTEILCVVDDCKKEIGKTINGIKIYSLENAIKIFQDPALILTKVASIGIYQKIRNSFTKVFQYQDNWPDISRTYQLLSNDISRDVLKQHDKMLQLGVYIDGFSVAAGSLYEHPIVRAESGEKIISIGTFEGTPLRLFSVTSKRQFEAHCFEPNLNIYPDLCRNIISWQMENKVTPLCAGIWSKTGMNAYVSDGGSGFNASGKLIDLETANINERTGLGNAIHSYSIDDYVKKSGFIPSMLECGRINPTMEILQGAAATIRKYKPKIIYIDYPHTQSVSYLKELVPEYEFYYSECGRRKVGAFFAKVPN